jgi:hypothetical protein
MPIRKPRLSRTEEEEYRRCLQQMQAEGIDVEIPERWLQQACPLDIFIAGGPVTSIFDLPGGGAAFAIWVRLAARRPVTVFDCAMTTARDDQIVLQAFFDERTPLWRLGHRDFPRREVLNMRIMDALTLNYGRMIEGWILAVGLKPMPEAFHHGMTVPFTMALLDQNENEICQAGELFVDRTWKREDKFVGRGSGLYGRDETSATSEPAFRPNLNVGRVPRPDPELLKKAQMAREKALSDSDRRSVPTGPALTTRIQTDRFCPADRDGGWQANWKPRR